MVPALILVNWRGVGAVTVADIAITEAVKDVKTPESSEYNPEGMTQEMRCSKETSSPYWMLTPFRQYHGPTTTMSLPEYS
jgi:hypothetical protein